MMKSTKLRMENDWEHYKWYYGDKRIKELYGVVINGDYFRVVKNKVYNTVYDHGHTYNVTTYTFNIIAEIVSIPVEIDIREFIDRTVIFIKNGDVLYDEHD